MNQYLNKLFTTSHNKKTWNLNGKFFSNLTEISPTFNAKAVSPCSLSPYIFHGKCYDTRKEAVSEVDFACHKLEKLFVFRVCENSKKNFP